MKKNKEKYVQVCPKCKSPDIYRDTSNKLTGAMGMPSLYVCNICEFSGYTFPEVPLSEIKEFEKKVDEKHLRDEKKSDTEIIDTAYGKNIVRVLWKITGPGTLILGLAALATKNFYWSYLLVGGLILTYFAYRKNDSKL